MKVGSVYVSAFFFIEVSPEICQARNYTARPKANTAADRECVERQSMRKKSARVGQNSSDVPAAATVFSEHDDESAYKPLTLAAAEVSPPRLE